MNHSSNNRGRNGGGGLGPFGQAGTIALVALASLAIAGAPAPAADNATSQKTLRQIGVMEKIIDKVLIDSPNVLVSGMENTRGLYVDPYGVIFTFTASILRGDSPFAGLGDLSFATQKDVYEIKTDADGNQVITIKKGKKDKEKAEERKEQTEAQKQKAEEQKEKAAEAVKDPEKVWEVEREQKYALAKEELVQTLLDYGETMTSLKSGQFVLVAGFIKDDDFFKAEKISRVVLKASIDDLRAFSSGDLTESAMRSRVQIEEY